MPLSFVTPREFPAAEIAGERFLSCVGTDMGGEVVASAEVPHTDPALKWFVTGVNSDVPSELIRTGEPPVASLCRARVGTLVHRGLARAVRVLPRTQDGSQR